MGNIVLLDDLTINKIAAGEVIERPASVIKEMVENSIDAGATNITVEIKNGGISFIRVTDNGKGIATDDLELAFERHATSKIRQADDLNTVRTMGFRGEALASIAAIANVELKSRTKNQMNGYRVTVEGGDVLEKSEIGCPKGTSITVRNLFFNTPVRYKFLKKDYTEAGYIEDAITRLALVNPSIAFKLISNDKTVIQTMGDGNLKNVIYSIYGKDVASAIVNVEYQYEEYRVTGVVGKPEIARSNRSNQLFFVNKRFVKDKTLSAASEQAFKGLLPIGKYGFLVLNVDMPSNKVDVNVHPAKLEVRFEEEGKVFKAIYHAVKDSLLKEELVANTERKFDSNSVNSASSVENTFANSVNISTQVKSLQSNNELNDGNKTQEKHLLGGLFRKFRTGGPDFIYEGKNNLIEELYESKNAEITYTDTQNTENVGGVADASIKYDYSNTSNTILQTPEELAKREKEAQENAQKVLEKLKNLQQEMTKELEAQKEETSLVEKNEKVEEKVEENTESSVQVTTKNVQDKEEIVNKIISQEIEDKKEEMLEEIKKMDASKLSEEENKSFEEMYVKTFGKLPVKSKEEVEDKDREKKLFNAYEIIKNNNVSVFENMEEYKTMPYKFLGIAFSTYIILEIDNEIYILDQHAAHERIMYEKVKKNYYSDEEKNSQILLLPDIITLSHKEIEIAKDNIAMFRKAGFELEDFGDNTIKLTGVPDICIDLDTKELFLETLDEINTVARTAKQEIEEKFLSTVACKAAVKANMALDKLEVEKLMDTLLKLPNPFTCPHGRPTAIKMSKYDIERKFARK